MTNRLTSTLVIVRLKRFFFLFLVPLLFAFTLCLSTSYAGVKQVQTTNRAQLMQERTQLLQKVKMESASNADLQRLQEIDNILAQPIQLEKEGVKPAVNPTIDQTEIEDINN